MLNDVQAIVLLQLPFKIEMVGGPFCGVTLYTRKNRVSDVMAELLEVEASRNGIDQWVPVSRQEIHVVRAPYRISPDGQPLVERTESCVYRPQRDGRWLYSGAKVEDSPPAR